MGRGDSWPQPARRPSADRQRRGSSGSSFWPVPWTWVDLWLSARPEDVSPDPGARRAVRYRSM